VRCAILVAGLAPKADAVHDHEAHASGAEGVGRPMDGGGVVLLVGRERGHVGVEARGPPARDGLGHVALGRSQHAEATGEGRRAEEAQQELLRLEKKAAGRELRELAGAEQHVERGAPVLERGDPGLDAWDHPGLSDEDRRAVGQPGDQDLVVPLGGEGSDLLAGEPVERARLDDLDVAAQDGGHVGDDVAARRLPHRDQADLRHGRSSGMMRASAAAQPARTRVPAAKRTSPSSTAWSSSPASLFRMYRTVSPW